MSIVIVVLRLIHIFSGIMWIGGAFLLTHVVQPVTMQGGPEGQRWFTRITSSKKFGNYMAIAALLTTLAGIILYVIVSGRFNARWITSGPGLALTIGGLAGIAAFVVGFIIGQNSSKLGALSQEIQAAGGPPPADKLAALQALAARQKRISQIDEVLMIITIAAMISAYNL